jgi:hypothetical protein
MLKYKINNIIEGKNSNTVYVYLYDDKEPEKILTSICLPHETDEQFEAELERKTVKYLESTAAVMSLKDKVTVSLTKVEPKIEAIKTSLSAAQIK